jgi:hypothetical protein
VQRVPAPKWTEADLRRQFASSVKLLPHFREAASSFNLPIEILMAIASRETNIQNIVGDGGHGYGLMQVDNRSNALWVAKGLWREMREAIRKGAEILNAKRTWVIQNQSKQLRVGGREFKGRGFQNADEILRVAIAGYNCGEGWAYYHFSTSGDPDRGTTGRDYSADVLKRAAVFSQLLTPRAEQRA